MIQNENLIKLIKNETQSNLNFYKNLVKESKIESKELIETASKIRKVLDNKQKKSKNNNQDFSNFSKFSKQEPKNQKNYPNADNASLRKEIKPTPKLQIYNQKYFQKNEFFYKKFPKIDNIFSSYNNENLTFYPSSNYTTTDESNFGKDLSKKGEQRTKIIRNDIDYDTKIKQLFFMNRYLEYSYQDKGDNLYETGDLFRYLYQQTIKQEHNQGIKITKQESIYFDIYKNLLNQIKNEKEEFINKPYTDSTPRDEGKLTSDELKNINRYKTYKNKNKLNINISGEGKDKDIDSSDFKLYFLSKISANENNIISPGNNETFDDVNNEKEILSLGKNVSDVSFNIDIETNILKRKNKRDIQKKININGPIFNIFKSPNSSNDLQTLEEKTSFDIRYLKLDEEDNEGINNNNVNYAINKKSGNDLTKRFFDINIKNNVHKLNMNNIFENNFKEKFTIKKIMKGENEIHKQITFYSNKIPEFQNKSIASLLIELKKYYKDFLFNIENASYITLKFLSNPNCEYLELHPSESQKLLYNLYWHPKIQMLSIPTSFVASLKIVMETKNWECILTTLTLNQDMGISSPTFEESIYNLFCGINSVTIQNIHFINVPYDKKLAKALFKHIELFYSINSTMLNSFFGEKIISKRICSNSSEKDFTSNEEVNDPKTIFFLNYQRNKLPIINLTWKKNPNAKLNKTNFEESVDLRGIYYILMDMLIKAYIFNNHELPEVFNKLDLSEAVVSDDTGYLVKIITQFKIIKELDISNTKIYYSGKIINNDNFLRKIKLTNDIMKAFNTEDETNFINETEKEIEFYKDCTEQERNSLPNNLKDEEMSYNYFMGIFPILEKIYVYNTDIKESVARDIYILFKKLKCFQGFYCTASANNNIVINTINSLCNIIQSDSSSFCENIFKISSI